MKNGAPIMAVITPIGTGFSGESTRATISALTASPAPKQIEIGITAPLPTPVSFRAICGITSPINPIVPHIATLADVIATADSTTKICVLFTFTPMSKACRSPKSKALRFLYWQIIIIHAGNDIAVQIAIECQLHLSKLPSDQNTKFFRPLSRVAYIKSPTHAPQIALIATPARIVEVGSTFPLFVPITQTAKLANNAKAKAEISIENGAEKNIIAITAPKLAPAETPVIEGSANGFLKIHCNPQPANERLAPVMRAATMRGKRSWQTIIESVVQSLPINDATMFSKGTSTLPK